MIQIIEGEKVGIKEIGAGTVVVIGGAIYGISEYGLGDVLQEELKNVAEVPISERQAYMQTVADQFTEFYEGAVYGTENFDFATDLKYNINARRATFTQVSQSLNELTNDQVKELKTLHSDNWMCDTEDSLLFTDKGWTYKTKLKNLDGRLMVVVTCKPNKNSGLRVG